MNNENGKVDYRIMLDTSDMEKERDQVAGMFQGMGKEAQTEGAKIDNAFSAAAANIGKAFAGLAAVSTFTNLSRKIMAVRGEFQQLEVAFQTMLGSVQQADQLMNQLVATAATTPFGLQDVAGGAKQLLAYGIAADEVNETLVRLGDIAAGLSIPLNDLVYLYGTTMTQGRLFTQDLRQFMGRGIPVAEELAKQFGVTKDKVGELVTAGKVGFPQIKKAIESMTNAGGKFGGLMEKQSHTITGQISNIEDALDMMYNDLGKQSEGIINTALSSVSFVVEHYKQFGTALLTVVAAYGEYKAALMAVAAYNAVVAKQEAAQVAAREAALSAAIAQAQAENTDTAATQANTAAKAANKSAIDLEVASVMRSLELKSMQAAIDSQAAQRELLLAQQRTAAAEQMFVVRQQEYMAAVRSGQISAVNAARTNLETAATEKQAAAKALNTAQSNAAAAAKVKEAAASKLSTFQTQVDTAAKTANATATGLWATVTNAAAGAWRALTAAMATNPIGMALVAITTIIGALSLFKSNTDDASDSMQKFRDAVMDDQSKLETYIGTLNALHKDTKTYKDTLSNLRNLASDYGVTLDEENGVLKDQEKAYKDLSAAISKQAAEKVLAESASAANTKAMEAEKTAMDKLMERAKEAHNIAIQDESGKIVGSYQAQLEGIANITESSWAMISQHVMSQAKSISDAFAESQAEGEKAISEVKEGIEVMMESYGASEKEIKAFSSSLDAYLHQISSGFNDAYGEMNRTEAQLRGLAGATNDFAKETEAMKGTASDTYDELATKQEQILNKITDINNNPMNPQVDASQVEYLKGLLYEVQGLMGNAVTQGSLADLKQRLQEIKKQRDAQRGVNDKEADKLDKQAQAVEKRIKDLEKMNHESNKPKTTTRTTRTTRTGTKIDKKQIAYDVQEIEKNLADTVKDLQEKLQEQINDATTAAMKEGTAKQLQAIKDDTQDKLEAIDDEIKELQKKKLEEDKEIWLKQNPKKKEYDYKTPAEESIEQFLKRYPELAALYAQRRAQIEKAGAEAAKKVTDAQSKQEASDMNEYLIEYGTYTQKRLAIFAEYYKKMQQPGITEGQKKKLQKEMEETLSGLNFEQLKQSMSWDVIFGDLSHVAEEELKKVRKQLMDLRKDPNYKNRKPEEIKVIEDALNSINDEMSNRGGLFGGLVDALNDYKDAVNEVTQAEENLKKATTEAEREEAQKALDRAKGRRISAETRLGADMDKTAAKTQKLMGAIADLGSAEELSVAQLGSMIANISDVFGESAGKIGGWIGAVLGILDSIGDQDIDKWVKGIATKIFTALGSALNSKFSPLHYLMGGLMGASNNLDEDIPKLTEANEDLSKAIERLTKVMEESAGSDAAAKYEDAVEKLRKSEENTRKIIQESAETYSQGFAGLGGKHSALSYINDAMNSSDWKRISDIVGRSITNAQGFFSLTSEEMAKVRDEAVDLYTKIKNASEDGYAGVSEYMDQYVEYYEQLIELQEQYNETLTAASFDTIKSGLESLLLDTEADATKVINNVKEMMQKAVVNLILTKSLQPKLKEWYNQFAEAMADDTLSAMESAALQQGYADIYNKAKEETDAAFKAAGLDKLSGSEADSSSGAWSALGEETGRSLDGRFAAMQIQVTQISQLMLINNDTMTRMDIRDLQKFSMISEMANLVFISTGYLERIARNSDSLPSIHNELKTIRQNTDKL